MSFHRVSCHCKLEKCFCGIPLAFMPHLQLPCCDGARFHVLCIENKNKCFKCHQEFDQNIKDYISKVFHELMVQFESYQLIQEQRNNQRIELKRKVFNIIIPFYQSKHKQNTNKKC